MFRVGFLILLFLSAFYIQKTAPLPGSLIKRTNRAEIHFFKGKQPCVYKTKREIDITYLKELILKVKNKSDLKCDSTGEIIYFRDKNQLLKVYFSSKETGSKYKASGAITFNIGGKEIKSLLTYRAGMLLNEEYYQLQKR